MEQAFLLRAYGACWGPEAGPWNLSVQNKYLEYMFARFFEEHFPLPEYVRICNIGIGADTGTGTSPTSSGAAV